jgi:hypothetical protein
VLGRLLRFVVCAERRDGRVRTNENRAGLL